MDTSKATVQRVNTLPAFDSLARGQRHAFFLEVVAMADGNSVGLPVNILQGAAEGPRLLLVAGVHGNEYEGITAQVELWEELDPATVRGTVIMVPVANPPAFRVGQRRNPEDSLDMNRAFPGKVDGSITERLAYHLYEDIASRVDMVLSMHGWTQGSLVVPYTEYPRAEETTAASLAAARAFGLEYVEAFDWPHGLLVAACTRAGIPAIEPEIGGLSASVPERRDRYKQGARNLMHHLGMLAGEAEVPSPVRQVTRSMLYAPCGGILRQCQSLGTPVAADETVATIHDLNGFPLASCQAPRTGFVAAQQLMATVNPGDLVAVIFTPVAETGEE